MKFLQLMFAEKSKVFIIGVRWTFLCFRYAGLSWKEKVRDLRSDLAEKGASAMVVTALDEIAWLFNIRGQDIPYSPVVKAYAFVAEVKKTPCFSLKIKFGTDSNLSLPFWRSVPSTAGSSEQWWV